MTIEYTAPVDTDAFEAHYSEIHVPLVLTLPGLARFTLSRPRGLGTQAPYLVAELWFEDAEAMKTAMKSPEMATTAADAQSFQVASTVMFTGEVLEVG